jgi:hypothetical protein
LVAGAGFEPATYGLWFIYQAFYSGSKNGDEREKNHPSAAKAAGIDDYVRHPSASLRAGFEAVPFQNIFLKHAVVIMA